MNTRQPITIADKEYQMGFSFRAIKLFEEMTGKSIQEISGSWDNLLYAFCSLKAINADFRFTIDEFVDMLDTNPQLLIDLTFGIQEHVEPNDRAADLPTAKKKIQLAKIFFGLWILSVLLLLSPVLIPVIFGLIWILGSLKALYRLIANRGSKRAQSFKHSQAKG